MTTDNASKIQAAELLKNADRLLKSGDMTAALEEVEKALLLDPSNFYARAYKIRLIESTEKPQRGEKTVTHHAAEKATIAQPPITPPQPSVPKKPEQPKIVPEKHDRERLEEARKHAEGEIQKRMLELEAMQKHIEDQRIKIEQDRTKLMDTQRKLVEDFQRKEIEFQRSMEEQRRLFDEERKTLQQQSQQKNSDSRQQLEEEAKKVAELRRKLDGEIVSRERAAQQAIDDARKKIEEEAMRHSHIARKTIDEERMKLAADRNRILEEFIEKENKLRASLQEERKHFETDIFRQAEETARLKLEGEVKRRIDEEFRKKERENELLHAAREEGKRQAKEAKVHEYLLRAQRLYAEHDFNLALTEVTKIFFLVPDHAQARLLDDSIRKERKELLRRELNEARSDLRQKAADVYRRAVRKAYVNAPLSSIEQSMLENLRQSLNIQLDEIVLLDSEGKREAYGDFLREAFSSGTASRASLDRLASLRKELGITDEEHTNLERAILKS